MAQIGVLYIFVPNTVIRSAYVNQNFADIKSVYNAHDVATSDVHGITAPSVIVGTLETQTLENKTLVSPIIQTSIILDQTTADYTIIWNDPAVARQLTIIDPLGDDDFLFADATQDVSNKTFTDNIVWESGQGSGNDGILDHANTAARTYTFPDASGNVPSLPTAATTETGTGAIVRATSPTISNATLSGQPSISDFTNAQHDHTNAANGGSLGANTVGATQLVDTLTWAQVFPTSGNGNHDHSDNSEGGQLDVSTAFAAGDFDHDHSSSAEGGADINPVTCDVSGTITSPFTVTTTQATCTVPLANSGNTNNINSTSNGIEIEDHTGASVGTFGGVLFFSGYDSTGGSPSADGSYSWRMVTPYDASLAGGGSVGVYWRKTLAVAGIMRSGRAIVSIWSTANAKLHHIESCIGIAGENGGTYTVTNASLGSGNSGLAGIIVNWILAGTNMELQVTNNAANPVYVRVNILTDHG